ncbi:hypothetical protein SPSYN_02858 [Sporotomaculum syntrophicum]|uniref:Pyruvate formate lyase-activating protein n=1 Tax=Sporotomaculum syntrophicum TaxID=182264 RepID=A0A9D2WND2_9FIRM|nr:DUF1786 domain-containing protein [Sporotomaculum syntrophicum]KAF1083946.1 hypothetical protein SPSYN_02858 [Sporotomaculum syntrophicum]
MVTAAENEALFKQTDILTVDVGSETQDVLVYQTGKNIENCPKLVMPSQTQLVAGQIRRATQQRHSIYLYGHVMGGGANFKALRQHLAAGLKVYATEQAAYTFNDNLNKVRQMGIELVEAPPADADKIWLGDIDLPAFQQALAAFDQPLPAQLAIAVQDHGFSAEESNRTLRFRLWKEFIDQGGVLRDLVFTGQIPEVYTRMKAVREIAPGAVLTDTGTAAVLGITADPTVRPQLGKGLIAVNIGNAHTLAAAIRGQRVYGLFEHHTGMLNTTSLASLVKRLQNNELTHEEIYNAGGHGAALHPDMGPGWDYIAVTGPRRAMAKPLGWHEAAPYGDMMLTGCFGLLIGLGVI